MADWETRRLGDVAQLKMGQSPPGSRVTDLDGGLPFLQGNAEFGAQCPTATLQCDEAPRRSAPGDSLISVRAPVGAINRADREYGIGRGLAAVTFDVVDPDFGHHALVEWSRDLQRVSQGTTFSAIGRIEMAALEFPVPPLEEQRRIAEILDTIDEAIQASERVVAKLGSLQSGLIDRSFRRSQGTVAELGTSCLGQGEYGCVAPAEPHRPGWPRYVRITDLTDTGTLRRDSNVGVSPSAARTAILRSGDLVFARSGATVGKTYLYDPADGLCAFAGYLIRFRPDPTKALPEFVRWWTHSGSYWRWVKRTMREGAQPNINAQEYAKAVLPLPPIEEQRRIVKAIDQVYAALKSERDFGERLRRLRSGLAADLLSGRVRTVAA